jgi:hypothetical protein
MLALPMDGSQRTLYRPQRWWFFLRQLCATRIEKSELDKRTIAFAIFDKELEQPRNVLGRLSVVVEGDVVVVIKLAHFAYSQEPFKLDLLFSRRRWWNSVIVVILLRFFVILLRFFVIDLSAIVGRVLGIRQGQGGDLFLQHGRLGLQLLLLLVQSLNLDFLLQVQLFIIRA